jgi:hypothetical protein
LQALATNSNGNQHNPQALAGMASFSYFDTDS